MDTQFTDVVYNVGLIKQDMAARGWLAMDLSRRAGTSHQTVARFLTGERQTARTAKKIADAFGVSVRRYMVTAEGERVSA